MTIAEKIQAALVEKVRAVPAANIELVREYIAVFTEVGEWAEGSPADD